MELQPLNGHLIVEPIEAESQRASGLIIPDTAKEKPQKGIVAFAASDSVYPVGAVVLYSKYAGIELGLLGRKLLAIKERDVIAAVIEDAV